MLVVVPCLMLARTEQVIGGMVMRQIDRQRASGTDISVESIVNDKLGSFGSVEHFSDDVDSS